MGTGQAFHGGDFVLTSLMMGVNKSQRLRYLLHKILCKLLNIYNCFLEISNFLGVHISERISKIVISKGYFHHPTSAHLWVHVLWNYDTSYIRVIIKCPHVKCQIKK